MKNKTLRAFFTLKQQEEQLIGLSFLAM